MEIFPSIKIFGRIQAHRFAFAHCKRYHFLPVPKYTKGQLIKLLTAFLYLDTVMCSGSQVHIMQGSSVNQSLAKVCHPYDDEHKYHEGHNQHYPGSFFWFPEGHVQMPSFIFIRTFQNFCNIFSGFACCT